MTLSIIIPVLNEAAIIRSSLNHLNHIIPDNCELIVVDGGSSDITLEIAKPLVNTVVQSESGRAVQMNKGAELATGKILLFLHVDTELSKKNIEAILNFQSEEEFWGRFDVTMSNPKWIYQLIAFFMNLRSRITSIATGDQAIFVERELFKTISGFPEIALMEDVAICKQLRKYARPICLKQTVTISARRWEEKGVLKTILLMWLLRLAYFFNVSPNLLKKFYEK